MCLQPYPLLHQYVSSAFPTSLGYCLRDSARDAEHDPCKEHQMPISSRNSERPSRASRFDSISLTADSISPLTWSIRPSRMARSSFMPCSRCAIRTFRCRSGRSVFSLVSSLDSNPRLARSCKAIEVAMSLSPTRFRIQIAAPRSSLLVRAGKLLPTLQIELPNWTSGDFCSGTSLRRA